MNNAQQAGWHFADTTAVDWQEVANELFNLPVRYKVAGAAEGFVMLLMKLPPGISSPAHTHETMEFLYVLEGSVRSNGVEMNPGHGCGSATGATHSEFTSDHGATVLVLVKQP